MTRKRLRLLAPLFAASLAVTMAACDTGEDDPEGPADPGEFPREETLYTTGKQWGPYSQFSPIVGADWATGIQGLVYETLFIFNPWTAELEPWLAESGEWVGDDEYVINLREGITWEDGEAFTAEDVKFTLDLRERAAVHFSDIDDWVDEVTTDGDLTVRVTFTDPRKGEWDNLLYSRLIAAQHVWGDIEGDEIVDDPGDGDRLVGTGAYTFHSSDPDVRLVLERKDDWWGVDALDIEMSPRYIVDWNNGSHNDIARQELEAGNIDLSNNFLPADTLAHPDIEAFSDEPPYMVAWNTAVLVPNNTRPPMDDPEFRRAMAFAIDIQDIVDTAYAGLVEASDPTGLPPTWTDQGMVDQAVVAEHGFSYDPAEAESILDAAGYTLDGDWRTTPGGDEIELSVIVPSGWTDWEIAANIIAESLQAVGLNVEADFPDMDTVFDLRDSGEYDLVVNNNTEFNNTPWSLWNYYYQQPIRDRMTTGNFHRADNAQAWQLVNQLGALSVEERAETNFDEVHGQLQEIFLTEMPVIPMWYNGLWAQWNTTHWTNWPKAPDGSLPSTWNNSWHKGAVYMLSEIQPVG